MVIENEPINSGESGSVILRPINVAGIIPGSAPNMLAIIYRVKSNLKRPRYMLTRSDGRQLITLRKKVRKNSCLRCLSIILLRFSFCSIFRQAASAPVNIPMK